MKAIWKGKTPSGFIPFDKTGNLYRYREMNKYEKAYVENRVKDVRKEQFEIFKKWVNNHPDVFNNEGDTFWYVQNAVGDIIGRSKEFEDYLKSLKNRDEIS